MPSFAGAAAWFSVATSFERGLRPSFGSCKVFGDKESISDAGVRMERRRMVSIKAADQNAIDSPLMSSMKEKIKDSLKAEEVSVVDAYGDGRHVSIDVVAEAFEGQSRVSRQRMVYKAIWEELQNAVHAVDQLRTRTPAEAAEAGKKL